MDMDLRTIEAAHEDLPGLAKLSFRLSTGCQPACRDYHATWTYRRIIGSVGGLEADRAALLPLIRAIGSAPDTRRWLLAGSADAGLIATVAAGLAQPETAELTLIDRCPTPLAVCTAYAQAAGLRLETHAADLLDFQPPKPFDVIIAHSVLGFFAPERQRDLLAHLKRGLRADGHFVLCTRWGSLAPDPEAREQRVLKALAAALAKGAFRLPEPRADFERRLCRDCGHVDDRSHIPATAEDCADLLSAAGFRDVRITLSPGVDGPFLSPRSRSRAILHARA
jgi:SAM-dependent methyltransferase